MPEKLNIPFASGGPEAAGAIEQRLAAEAREELSAFSTRDSLAPAIASAIRDSKRRALTVQHGEAPREQRWLIPGRSWGLAAAAVIALTLIPLAQWKLTQPIVSQSLTQSHEGESSGRGSGLLSRLVSPVFSPFVASLESQTRRPSEMLLTATEQVARNVVDRLPGEMIKWQQVRQMMPLPRERSLPSTDDSENSQQFDQRGAGSAISAPTASSTDAFRTSA